MPRSKPTSPLQRYFMYAAQPMLLFAFVNVMLYSTGDAADAAGNPTFNLGGLKGQKGNWHPPLMVAGLLVCSLEAALAYRGLWFGKQVNKSFHGAIQTLSVVCVSVGLWAMVSAHAESLSCNLFTAHSWIGLLTIVLYYANWVGGVLLYSPFALKVSPSVKAAALGPHAALGSALMFITVAAVASGVAEKAAWSYWYGYPVTEPDTNPAAHYHLLPIGIQRSCWLVVTATAAALCVHCAVHPALDPPPAPRRHSDQANPLLDQSGDDEAKIVV